jgi:hypothetical protein
MKNTSPNPAKYATGVHVISAPGSGKSKLLQELARRFVASEQGLLPSLDPHGAPYDELVAMIRRTRRRSRQGRSPKKRQ